MVETNTATEVLPPMRNGKDKKKRKRETNEEEKRKKKKKKDKKKDKKHLKTKKHRKVTDSTTTEDSSLSEKACVVDDVDDESSSSREQEKKDEGIIVDAVANSASTTTKKLKDPPPSISSRPLVESSALDCLEPAVVAKLKAEDNTNSSNNTTLLLFYQYVEPEWSLEKYELAKKRLGDIAKAAGVTGRMRVAREGLNCTLTGTAHAIAHVCDGLRKWDPVFDQTEFKLTHDLPNKQRFPQLKVIPVVELVHYGLEGDKAPPIRRYQGTHLEPADYHSKLAEKETVVIDVRNHYEAVIGRFDPPNSKWLDPKMRKSTTFPVWLDDPETKKELANKQVLMYCTGGIRCERASALLKYKMETDPEVAELNIKGVYQLQGGIDKYFKEFPDGGYWKGKNYVFDKRFAHAPPAVAAAAAACTTTASKDKNDGSLKKEQHQHEQSSQQPKLSQEVVGKCESCGKPWDMFRGKRRCPTCGVPSLICKDCWQQESGSSSKGAIKHVRCDLCVEQGIHSKHDLRSKEHREIQQYEERLMKRGLLLPKKLDQAITSNPDKVTRLYLKNMCRKDMSEEILTTHLSGITHIVWKMDHRSQEFLGSGWVEMESADAAARAVAKSGQKVLGRPLYVEFQPPNGKDVWPPPSSAVNRNI